MTEFDIAELAKQTLGLTEYVRDKPILLAKMKDVAQLLKEVTISLRDSEVLSE